MPKPRRAKQHINKVAQVKALTGPLQHQIVATLERVGPVSARQLAEHLGLPPESLYYHLRNLKAVGVLAEYGRQKTNRRPEVVFGLLGREMVFDAHSRNPGFLRAMAALQRSLMGMATRLYDRALRRPESIRSGKRRNLCLIQQHARLGATDLAELNRRLEDMAQFMEERDDPGEQPFVSLTVALSPVLK